MKALIRDNQVVDVADKEHQVHPSLTWMDCPDECISGQWHLVDGKLEEKENQGFTNPSQAPFTYADKRRFEYPPIEDYLDGIVKGDTAQVDKYISDCKAVKDKYPK